MLYRKPTTGVARLGDDQGRAPPHQRTGQGAHWRRAWPSGRMWSSTKKTSTKREEIAMTIAVIGATGRVGGGIVRGVMARGDAVTALVRDAEKARRAFGEPNGLHIRFHTPGRPARRHRGTRRDPQGVHRDGINRDRGRAAADRDQRRRRDLLDRAGHRRGGAQHLGGLTGNQPASPLQHRPVRFLDRSVVLRRSALRSSRCRCSPRRTRCARRAHGPAWPAAAAWP